MPNRIKKELHKFNNEAIFEALGQKKNCLKELLKSTLFINIRSLSKKMLTFDKDIAKIMV